MQMRRTHFHTVSRVVGYNAMFLSLSVLFVVKFVVCHLVFLKPEVTIFKHMQPDLTLACKVRIIHTCTTTREMVKKLFSEVINHVRSRLISP